MALPIISKADLTAPTQETGSTTAFPLISAKQLDDNGIVELPEQFNGMSPDQALNESDLSFTDRFKMSVGQVGGNKKGNIDYLKQKGYDATLNSEGEVVYKKPGTDSWRRADEVDSWRASEIIGDVADILPDLAAGAAQTAVVALGTGLVAAGTLAAPVTGGTSTAGAIAGAAALNAGAAAIIGKARLNWGRSLNTYQADSESEFRDLAMETVLGGLAGGAGKALEVGAQPTARWMSERLHTLGEKAASSQTYKDAASFFIRLGTGVKESAADHMIDRAQPVAKILDRYGSMASAESIREANKAAQVNLLKRSSDLFKAAETDLYKRGEAAVLNAVPDDFILNPRQAAEQVTRAMGGLVDIKVDGVKGIMGNLDKAVLAAEGNLKKIRFALKPDTELVGTPFEDFLKAGTSQKQLQRVLNKALQPYLGSAPLKGKEAAAGLMKMRQIISSQLWDSSETASRLGKESVSRLFSTINKTVDDVIKGPLDIASKGAYSELLNNTHSIKQFTSVLNNARNVAKKEGVAAYEPLLNQLFSNGTSRDFRNQQMGRAMAFLEQSGSTRIPKILDRLFLRIDDYAAASEFAPWTRKSMQQYAGPMMAGTVFTNPAIASGIATAGALTSPRMALKATNAFGAVARQVKGGFAKTNDALARQMIQHPDIVRNMRLVNGVAKSLSKSAINNPNLSAGLVTQVFGNLYQAPLDAQQQTDQLLQQGGVR